MSTLSALFRQGGHPYRTVPDVIALLPRGMQHAATVAMRCVLRLAARNELDEKATDKKLAWESEQMALEAGKEYEGIRGWSASLIQKGLHALHVELGKLGLPLITRKSGIGMAGRRQITVMPLAGRAKPDDLAPARSGVPRAQPKDDNDARPVVVSPLSTGGGAGGAPAVEAIDPALITRARTLIPAASVGDVVDAILVYKAPLVSRALDEVERHNRAPGNKPVRSWGFVARTLPRLKAQQDAEALAPSLPEIPAAAAPDPAAERKAREKAEAAAEARRTAEMAAAWGVLPEPEREAIRDAVRAAHPRSDRWPGLFEGLCLAELEQRRRAVQEPRGP